MPQRFRAIKSWATKIMEISFPNFAKICIVLAKMQNSMDESNINDTLHGVAWAL